jgi:type II secretory pathway pseudopilin PulG
MDVFVALVLVFALGALFAWSWRPSRGRRRTAEEALATDALRREQEAQLTESIYQADRYNVPGVGGKR